MSHLWCVFSISYDELKENQAESFLKEIQSPEALWGPRIKSLILPPRLDTSYLLSILQPACLISSSRGGSGPRSHPHRLSGSQRPRPPADTLSQAAPPQLLSPQAGP